ncbi:MAG: hypothetical protein CL579_13150 [Alteromonadaceae bacterium]|nr:hypothetical protein [Alteromonadaceae bacterium]MBB19465.1 hypothetical protein [Rickettsiales bacterium]
MRHVTLCILVVFIIGDTSRVSNIYTKQAVQNTELKYINQLRSANLLEKSLHLVGFCLLTLC